MLKLEYNYKLSNLIHNLQNIVFTSNFRKKTWNLSSLENTCYNNILSERNLETFQGNKYWHINTFNSTFYHLPWSTCARMQILRIYLTRFCNLERSSAGTAFIVYELKARLEICRIWLTIEI